MTPALVAAQAPAPAQGVAGQILFALGRVEIQRGTLTVPAQRGTPLQIGDAISTGPTGMAQVRFKDGALLSLRAGSSMVVEDYRLPQATAPTAPSAPAAVTPAAPGVTAARGGGGRSVLRLVRGAFRTITGLIGKGTQDEYRVVTPAATIGIRGTDYTAAYCSGDCGGTPDGLYVGCSSGEIQVNNDGGELVLGDNQYGSVKDTSSPPAEELVPPEVLETPIEAPAETEGDSGEGEPAPDAGATQGGGTEGGEPAAGEAAGTETAAGTESGAEGEAADGNWGEAGSGDYAPPPDTGGGTYTQTTTVDTGATQPEGEYELLPGTPGTFAFALGTFRGAGDNGVYTDDSASPALVGFLTDVFTSIGSSQNVNQGGFDTLRWGRWSGGDASIGGSPANLSNQSLHWIYSFAPDAPSIPITGSATYSLVGNTDPTDNFGNVGFLGSATFSANFTNQTVASTLRIGINDQVWIANGSGSIGGALFSGSYAVNVNDALGTPFATGSGGFSGFFTDGAATAGLSYDLTSGSKTVSGAAAFGPQP